MATEEQIREIMEQVMVPGVKRSVGDLNLLKGIAIDGGTVKLSIASTALGPGAQNWVRDRSEKLIKELGDVTAVEYEFVEAKPAELNDIKNIVAVMSGKGGVGKSLVTGLLSVALRRKGYTVGILDADITGPSIPKMFGVNEKPTGCDSGILSVPSRSGIGVMSINLLLPSEDDAVIWRGPLIGRAITQFGENVLWGKLDYLVIDLPPGTADAPLTVMQSFPVTGAVVVFTPQDLTAMIVRKAINMARSLDKPILGVVENMAYLYVAEIDKKLEIFGKSHGEEMAETTGAPLLAKLGIDPELAKLCDAGDIESYGGDVVESLGENLLKAIAAQQK